jgi:hypothetical protein
MGAVDTTYTFTATDTITSTKMNNIIDQTTITSDAIIGTTLEVASGKLKIRSAGITSNELATNAITTTAINDGAVTPAKLSTAGPSWDNAGGTLTLSQRAVELGNGITADSTSYIDFHSSFPIIDNDARIIRDSGINGVLTISNQGTGAIVTSASGGVTFGSANMPVPSGTAPLYGVRAWVAFDPSRNAAGTADTTNTTRYLIASGNVTSVTKTNTGKYTVLIATAFPDANYSYFATAQADSGNEPLVYRPSGGTKSTTQFQIETQTRSGSLRDFNEVCISFLR